MDEKKAVDTLEKALLIDLLEHESCGGGLVIHPEVAEATPCKCFEYEGEEYCWSPGVLGLISGKKNPDQMARFCKVKQPASPRAKERIARFKKAIEEAHRKWEEEGGGVREWWKKVGESLRKHGLKV